MSDDAMNDDAMRDDFDQRFMSPKGAEYESARSYDCSKNARSVS